MEKKVNRKLWMFFLASLGAALASSLWAWVARGSCGACEGTPVLLAGISLAPIGAAFYAVILGSAVHFGPNRFSFASIAFAAAVHIVLLVLLVHRGIFCPPCLMAGSSALVAMLISFFVDPLNVARASWIMPLGAVASHAALFAAGAVTLASPAGPSEVRRMEIAEPRGAVLPGRASMLIYTRSGCRYCEELEREVLPPVQARFGAALSVERRPAPEGLPSPTIIVGGAVRTVFPGLPTQTDLAGAVARAIGGKEHVPSLLPEPR